MQSRTLVLQNGNGMKTENDRRMNGWLALSPLLLFLCIYLVSSIVAEDFYKVPIAAAFPVKTAVRIDDKM